MRRSVGALVLALAGADAAAAGLAPGRYDGTLCVATAASAPPSCGAVALDVRSASRVRVVVADVVYRLHVGPSRLDVATMHGPMQIDEFSADYVWEGPALRFVDADKNVHYEVRVG